jgi:phosphate transport system substrate-binding protein
MAAQSKRHFLKGIITSSILILCLVSAALAEEVKIGAGAAPTENIFNRIKAPFEKSTGITLTIIDSGPSQALKDLDKGILDAAAGGVTFGDWMKMMEKDGYPINEKSGYKYRVIGKDIVQVFTHKDVTVSSLSKTQLAAIFTGKAKNWSEVGGPNLPIVVLLGTKIPGTQSVFQKQALDGAAYLTGAMEGTTAPDLKEKVKVTSGAVCLGPMTLADASVNVPAIPEIGRPITLINKGEPSPGLLKIIDYINGDGKQYIAR